MDHRHIFSSTKIFEIENEPSRHLTEQPCMHIARTGAAENNALMYPTDMMSIDEPQYASHFNPVSRPVGFSSSAQSVPIPHHQQDASGPSHGHYPHPPTDGSNYGVPENYAYHASSSNYGGQTFHRVDGGFFDPGVGNERRYYKRKGPGVPALSQRDGGSTYHEGCSSSDHNMSSDLWHEKQNGDFLRTPWDYPTMNPNYRGSDLSIGCDNTLRNVRSRAALDLETTNIAASNLSNNVQQHSYATNQPMDWSQTISPAACDGNLLNHETNPFVVGSVDLNSSLEKGGLNTGFITGSSHVSQNFHDPSAESSNGVTNSYMQRSASTSRVSSSNFHSGHPVATNEGLQLATENYTWRHPRPLSTMDWRTNDRNGRTRMSSVRFRSFHNEASFRERLAPRGIVISDRSRHQYDHHRDMRLDIDDMSYEELLALGERIGHVSTGLSEDLISKALRESIYCSSDLIQEEGTCVICLEEYKNMDEIGVLNTCGHDFHSGCIRKWLSLKNMCPICKASALGDSVKKK